ncbi:TraB/GumN family protein [Shimia biformata]|uniref:TraB/GumN family protein n=1 Tax=Shimia biformata TaxID=1294299 RepID=UPI00194E5AC6|nr:TraB/GumN family protein [Shimia biformata]
MNLAHKLVFATCLLASLSGPVHAACEGPSSFDSLSEEDQARLEEKSARAPFHEGILWQVEKGGVTSIIVGTMHFPDTRHAATVAAVDRLAEAPTTLFLELTSDDQRAFQTYLGADPSRTLITEGPSLIDRLGEDLWAKLLPRLQEVGLPPFMAAKYQPWLLGTVLSMPKCALVGLQAGEPGLDVMVEDWAVNKGLAIRSLDNAEDLFDLMAGDPLDEQVEMLKWSLSLDFDLHGANEPGTIVAMYRDETLQLFWEYTIDSALALISDAADKQRAADMFEDIQRDLIDGRNQAWVEVLAPAMSKTPSVVAVGALHLPGGQGVLALLRDQGFSVTRLAISPG